MSDKASKHFDFHLLPLFELIAVETVEEKGKEEVEHHEVANLGSVVKSKS